jgi:hypothetical protein
MDIYGKRSIVLCVIGLLSLMLIITDGPPQKQPTPDREPPVAAQKTDLAELPVILPPPPTPAPTQQPNTSDNQKIEQKAPATIESKPLPAVKSTPADTIPASSAPKMENHEPVKPKAKASLVDRAAIAEGRIVLRLIAQGKGPDIRIAWPGQRNRRDSLYRLLAKCYGMRTAILDRSGNLYIKGGVPGRAWDLDRDRYSSFLRAPSGRLPSEERRILSAIENYHDVRGNPVRVFPRIVDAGIVGSLFRAANRNAATDPDIRARYNFDHQGLQLIEQTVDGRPLHGRTLVPVLHRGCR